MGDKKPTEPLWDDDFLATAVTSVTEAAKLRDDLRGAQPQQPFLTVLEGDDVGKMFPLPEGDTVVGRSCTADICLEDGSISRRHIKLSVYGKLAVVEDLGSSNGTTLNGVKITTASIEDGDKLLLGDRTVVRFSLHDPLEQSFQERMYEAALRDPLTKAYNKRFFFDQLTTEISYARRHRSLLSLLMLDLDHFKRVNDTFGHPAGDEVLQVLARLITNLIRVEDVFVRYGGEEFIIICRGVDRRGAAILAERLRTAVERTDFAWDGKTMPVTVSVGVASWVAEQQPLELVEAADAALYRAKAAGRNRVVCDEPGDNDSERP